MSYAIYNKQTKRAEVDANGYAHIYSDKDFALKVMADQFAGREEIDVRSW